MISSTRFSDCPATSYSHRGKPPTTIGAEELNFRVRYGNGCDLFAIITRQIELVRSKLDKTYIECFKTALRLFNFTCPAPTP